MRTFEEIVKYLHESDSFFGFDKEVCVPFLPFEQAKEWLKESVTADKWEPVQLTEQIIIDEMRNYMEFAWGKAKNHRGLSAQRSIEKMEAWLFLLESDLNLDDFGYRNYGAPKLKAICDKYGFDVPDSPEIVNMMNSEHCGADYECGCG